MHISWPHTSSLKWNLLRVGPRYLNFGKENKAKISHESDTHHTTVIRDHAYLGTGDGDAHSPYLPFDPAFRSLKLLLGHSLLSIKNLPQF